MPITKRFFMLKIEIELQTDSESVTPETLKAIFTDVCESYTPNYTVKVKDGKEIDSISINHLKWWDKANGNTYCATRVCVYLINGEQLEYKLPFRYGYDSPEHKVLDLLKEKGLIPAEENSLWSFCNRGGQSRLQVHSRYAKKAECKALVEE